MDSKGTTYLLEKVPRYPSRYLYLGRSFNLVICSIHKVSVPSIKQKPGHLASAMYVGT